MAGRAHSPGGDEAMGGMRAVAWSGEVDIAVADALLDDLTAVIAKHSVVVVDLGGVTFMDSSGLHTLVTAHEHAGRVGHRMLLARVPGVVTRLLELSGIDDVFEYLEATHSG